MFTSRCCPDLVGVVCAKTIDHRCLPQAFSRGAPPREAHVRVLQVRGVSFGLRLRRVQLPSGTSSTSFIAEWHCGLLDPFRTQAEPQKKESFLWSCEPSRKRVQQRGTSIIISLPGIRCVAMETRPLRQRPGLFASWPML